MDEFAAKLFQNSVKHSDVPEEIIEKYKGRVSEDIISLWREYGFCTTADGYYKLVNPDDYADIFDRLYCGIDKNQVVVFVTAMADVLFYGNEEYYSYIDVRHEKYEIISPGKYFSLLMRRMLGDDFRHTVLNWEPYEEAVKTLGVPAYDECFGYEPLLSLGGAEKVENLRKVNLGVHLDIVSQTQEPIE